MEQQGSSTPEGKSWVLQTLHQGHSGIDRMKRLTWVSVVAGTRLTRGVSKGTWAACQQQLLCWENHL